MNNGPLSERDAGRIAAHFAGGHLDDPWTWVFYGDSITKAAKHTWGWRGFPDIFEERVRHELGFGFDIVINAGNSGQTSEHLVDPVQYDRLVRHPRPQVVLVMIGMNDMVRNTAEKFHANLRTLADRIRADGAIPVLQTSNTIKQIFPPQDEYHTGYIVRYELMPQFMEIVRQAAREKDVILIDHNAYWQKHAVLDEWLGETIHPGALGHLEIAKEIFRTFGIYDPESNCCKIVPKSKNLLN